MSTISMMKGGRYRNSTDSVQGSFRPKSHQNIAVTNAASSSSSPLKEGVVLISSSDYYYLGIDSPADSTSILLPPGIIPLLVGEGEVLHFIAVGLDTFNVSLIITE
ncbi:MAG: hypothetical protein DRQ89_14495 [Epsilonproteobacteria bacterium]|nr:MAG: hypothetical protein DRQ89_14495 [Campylobacterota bacterium]